MEASGDGNFFVKYEHVFKSLFQEERLGLGLYPGTCKNSNGNARPIFFGLKCGQILFFSGGVGVGGWCRKLALFLRLRKASSSAPFQEERLGLGLYPGGCNVTIQMGMLVQFFGFEV